MSCEKQFWIDFAQGRISVPDMLERTKADPALLDWMNGIVPERKMLRVVHKVIENDGYTKYVPEEVPFTAQGFIHEKIDCGHGGNLGRYLNVHSGFSQLLTEAFPEEHIAVDQTLRQKFHLVLESCPEAVGGPEVEQVIEDMLEALPKDGSKASRIKLLKEKIREEFPTAGGKWPRWVQESEWPLGSGGKPMRFVEQKREKGKKYADMLYTHFIFEDVDTGEQRIIDQFT